MNDSTDQAAPLPDQIANAARIERSKRKGTPAMLHRWWARRPLVIARIAAYLAITQEHSPTNEFLESLGSVAVETTVLDEARQRVRDAAWLLSIADLRRHGESQTDVPQAPEPLRVLDPFAGSGAIPIEIARLGCRAYAGDLSPVSHIILRATLDFPQAFGKPDSNIPGNVFNGRWSGLIPELEKWCNALERRVSPRLIPLSSIRDVVVDRYFWFHQTRCGTCGNIAPTETTFTLSERPQRRTLCFKWHDGHFLAEIKSLSENEQEGDYEDGGQKRGEWKCPVCDSIQSVNSPDCQFPPVLGAVRVRTNDRTDFVAIQPGDESEYALWTPVQSERLETFLSADFARLLHSSLPVEAFGMCRRHGAKTFRDLFSDRQLLVALEYVNGIRELLGEAKQAGLPADRIEAIATYLSFFVGYLADRNSMLVRWNARHGVTSTSFDRPTAAFTHSFVERSPNGIVNEWLEAISPAVEALSEVPRAAAVYCDDAQNLPFEDNFFDAVVTDPPYYDCIPYSDLSEFFWVWESSVLGSSAASRLPRQDEYITSQGNGSDGREAYRRQVLASFREMFRVLKPGRRLCLFFTGKAVSSFQEYVELSEAAGFELVDIRSLAESIRRLQGDIEFATYLLYFRKPIAPAARDPLHVIDKAAVLEAATAGKPVLYAALAERLACYLSQEDLKELLPPGGRGNQTEQLMEAIADADPRELLTKYYGKTAIGRLAEELSPTSESSAASPMDRVLSYFNLGVPPSKAHIDGVNQVRERLRRLARNISQTTERPVLTGSFLDACAAVERLLKLSTWGWVRLLFGPEQDEHLMAILREQKNSEAKLDRLSFGHVVALFRGLPDHVAASSRSGVVEQKFGRKHLYLPDNKKTKFADRLGELVTFRNKVEHNTTNYREETPLLQLREDLEGSIKKTMQLLDELSEARAIPRIAEPFQEIRDKYNRMTYRLSLDDGTDLEVRFSAPLELGKTYLYFGTETNPKPVDPLVLNVDDLPEIP